MKKYNYSNSLSKRILAITLSTVAILPLAGCVANSNKSNDSNNEEIVQPTTPEVNTPIEPIPEPLPTVKPQTPPIVTPEPPKIATVEYIAVTADNVNIRLGAGTSYSAIGTAEKSTLYALQGKENGYYKTRYKNKTVYISEKYCKVTPFSMSDNEKVEKVIAEGTNHLGTTYVYGAVRYHDGKGNLLKNFTLNAFDCSSLMQYMFYKGANRLIDVTTRTQIVQGTTISKSKLQRGDLMFFTNSSRKNLTGIERVGHVAIYLGDNYILHTASDYAKIEQISPTRWSYYIQSQRMV